MRLACLPCRGISSEEIESEGPHDEQWVYRFVVISHLKHIFSSKSNCLRCLWVSACVLRNNAVCATSE